MRHRIQGQTLLAALLLCLMAQGCTSGPVATAEKTVKLSKHAADTFLDYEYQNHATLKEKAPEVVKIANQIRSDQTKAAFVAAWDAIQNYKKARDADATKQAEAKAAMDAAVDKVATTGAQATTALNTAKSTVGGAP